MMLLLTFFSNVFQQSNKKNIAQNIKNISVKDTQIRE